MTAAHHRDITLRSAAQTTTFARALADALAPGDVILLWGEVGAGKSHTARSIIQHLMAQHGVLEDVPSPTFTLVQTYDIGSATVWHADLYRLSGPDEVLELGLTDAFATAICLVEWPDRLADHAPTGALQLALSMTEKPEERRMRLDWDAPRWTTRVAAACDAVNG